MRFIYLIIPIILSSSLLAFSDQDIDGVDDSIDLCPNTPFDITVNEEGCASSGLFTLQIGNDSSFNTISKRINNINLYLNYSYNLWDFSLSSSNYSVSDITTISKTEDSLYLTLGHTFKQERLNTKLSVGTKFAFLDDNNDSRKNDYFASLNFDYSINLKQNAFLHYNYTISGNSETIDYKNLHSVSIGTGYAVNSKWYSALSYNYSSSPYEHGTSYKAISWFNYYALPQNFYISANYARTVNKYPYRHFISLNLGVQF